MNRILQVLLEAIVVGIALIVFGYIGSAIAKYFLKTSVPLPEECKQWNKHYAMEWSLFFSGALLHIVFELMGWNRWYCAQYPL